MGGRIAITVSARRDPCRSGHIKLEVISLIQSTRPPGQRSTMEQIEDKILSELRTDPDAEIMVITCNQEAARLRIARPTLPARMGWKAGHAPELC